METKGNFRLQNVTIEKMLNFFYFSRIETYHSIINIARISLLNSIAKYFVKDCLFSDKFKHKLY